jgi:CarD family transcriptional regulator
LKFKKGDTVIYPQHGACIVHGIKRMKAFGAVQEYLILKTVINEMTLSVLSKADPRVPANWSRRFKNHQEKLKSGDVYQVAEVVRNLAARDRDSALSAAEKTMYDRARINLISEISPALKVSTDVAQVWLDAALEQGVLKPSKGAKLVKQAAKTAPKPVEKSAVKTVAKVAKAPAKAVAKKK